MRFIQIKPHLRSLSCGLFATLVPLGAANAFELGDSINYQLSAKKPNAGWKASNNGADALSTQISSGLRFALDNPLFDLALDYDLLGALSSRNSETEAVSYSGLFDQLVHASVSSGLINKYLKLDASLNADSRIENAGAGYELSLKPRIRKNLGGFASLQLGYHLNLSKAAELDTEQHRSGYSLGLSGDLIDGRFSWQGNYQDSQRAREQQSLIDTNKRLDVSSRYRISPQMELRLSGSYSAEAQWYRQRPSGDFRQSLYAAGLSWAPRDRYRLAFKLNQAEDSEQKSEVYGSGELSWLPWDRWQISVGYGDRLYQGDAGLKLTASIPLDDL